MPFRLDGGVLAAPAPPLGAFSIERLFNRDLSWLSFNDRVLGEAADETVPPMERLRFAAIVSSNLDEFFMIRVAELARLARRFPNRPLSGGLTAAQLQAQIREHSIRQKARQAEVLSEILAALRRKGIQILTEFWQRSSIDGEIRASLPEIKYVLRRAAEPPPVLQSERIHVFVRFPGEYAILTIQEREARLMALSPLGKTQRFALAERWLSDRAQDLFPGREVVEAFPFKIIRDADLRYRPDDEESLEQQVVQGVLKRKKARIVRLEVDAPSYSEGALFLASALRLDSAALYRFDLPLDLRTLSRIYSARAGRKLRYPRVRPQFPPPLEKARWAFDALKQQDILLHHPYDSFDAVVQFIKDAARDPKVTRIYHAMYRTSRESPVLAALKEAVRRGKKVTAYVEIKARFDELNNVRWAEELRKAGVRVVRPLGGYKVHSKVTQVFRLEDGVERSYAHLGTGNYHPATARLYTDLSLMTADPVIGEDLGLYFSMLEKRKVPSGMKELLAAPGNLQSQMVRLIKEETRIQREGGKGRIIGKMNALLDPGVIEALYEASTAGVQVDLMVRGICALRPGLKGLSENIRVVSVVDRFLEHSRIYYFGGGGEEKVYLSSADWMPRNFYARCETAFPIKDPNLRGYIRDVILAQGLADNMKAWTLKPDGLYARVPPPKPGKELRSQFLFEALALNGYQKTALEHRPAAASPVKLPQAA